MKKEKPRFRVTIELLSDGDSPDLRVSALAIDSNSIIGEGWLNNVTRRFEYDVMSGDFSVHVGHNAVFLRAAHDVIEIERKNRS